MSKWFFSTKEFRVSHRLGNVSLPSQDVLKDSFMEWCNDAEYSVIRNKITGEHISVLNVKRGNPAYARKRTKRSQEVQQSLYKFKFDYVPKGFRAYHPNRFTRLFFITLTLDHKQYTVEESWQACSGRNSLQNKFKSYLRRKFKSGFGCYSVREAQDSGHCHIHMMVLFDNAFPVHIEETKKGYNGRVFHTWRLDAKSTLQRSMHDAWVRYARGSFKLDIQGVVNGEITDESGEGTSPIYYLDKYFNKTVEPKNNKSILTHVYQKLLGLRDIMSPAFLQRLHIDPQKSRLVRIRNELKQIDKTILNIESKKNCFGYCLSAFPGELEQLKERKAVLKAQLDVNPWEYLESYHIMGFTDFHKMKERVREYNQKSGFLPAV